VGPEERKLWFSTLPFLATTIRQISRVQLSTLGLSNGLVWNGHPGTSYFEVAITRTSGEKDTISTPKVKTRPNGTPLAWLSHHNRNGLDIEYRIGIDFGPDHEIWQYLSEGDCISVYAVTRYAGLACDGKIGALQFEEKLSLNDLLAGP